jgi:hypothetical protein
MFKIINAYVIESPLFEVVTEDGIGSGYNLQIVCEDVNGKKYTHFKTFEAYERDAASNFVKKIAARGTVNREHWNPGTSWDHYATPQTYEEEKAEAIFNHGARA